MAVDACATRASIADREGNRAELVGAALRCELPRAEDMGVGEPEAVPCDRGAILQVAHEIILVDVTAGFKGVAVEENVSPHRASIHTDKHISAERAFFAR